MVVHGIRHSHERSGGAVLVHKLNLIVGEHTVAMTQIVSHTVALDSTPVKGTVCGTIPQIPIRRAVALTVGTVTASE